MLLASLYFTSSAGAIDITTCGQTIPPAAMGVLLADLSGCKTGIFVEDRGTLQLNGHAIVSSTFEGIECRGTCTISGPGEISGGYNGIAQGGSNRRTKLSLQGLSIHDVGGAAVVALGNRLYLTDVSVTHNGSGDPDSSFAISAGRIRGTRVTISDNVGYGIAGPAQSVRFTDLTATGNGQAVTFAYRASFVSSVLTGNDASETGVDVYTLRRPHVSGDTTCGRSGGRQGSEAVSWGVCSNDP